MEARDLGAERDGAFLLPAAERLREAAAAGVFLRLFDTDAEVLRPVDFDWVLRPVDLDLVRAEPLVFEVVDRRLVEALGLFFD